MGIKKSICLIGLLFCFYFDSSAQFKALITNLNNKEEVELKANEPFYFGTINSKEKNKGSLESVKANELIISGKSYKASDIIWIDFKGHGPKKNTSQIAKVLAYIGIGSLAFAGYEYVEANDKKTAEIVGVAGSLITIGAVCFWLLPHQPKYNFQSKHFLETVPLVQESK